MYDRCPECHGPTDFHAITSAKGVWRRWVECGRCKVYLSANAYGGNVLMTRTMPSDKMLAKDEVLPDAGTAADRFGQDDIYSLPEV